MKFEAEEGDENSFEAQQTGAQCTLYAHRPNKLQCKTCAMCAAPKPRYASPVKFRVFCSVSPLSQKHDFLPLAHSLAKNEDFKHIDELYIPLPLIFSFTKPTFLIS